MKFYTEDNCCMDTITLATGIIADRSVTFTATVIVAGIGIVLCTLLVLIGVFYAFGAGSAVSPTMSEIAKQASKIVASTFRLISRPMYLMMISAAF